MTWPRPARSWLKSSSVGGPRAAFALIGFAARSVSNGVASPDVIVAGASGVAAAELSLLAIWFVPAGAIGGSAPSMLGALSGAGVVTGWSGAATSSADTAVGASRSSTEIDTIGASTAGASTAAAASVSAPTAMIAGATGGMTTTGGGGGGAYTTTGAG